jgi:enamine deaminase RidA (YjgF/YER057c/UK114 family)
MKQTMSVANVQHSLVESDGVRRIFATACPLFSGITLREQTEAALEELRAFLQETDAAAQVVNQTIFLRNLNDIDECRAIIEAFYGTDLPATTYIVQPPCEGRLILIEAWALGGSEEVLHIDRMENGVTMARHNGIAWAYLGNVPPELPDGPIHDRAFSTFVSADARLRAMGWRLDDVVRAWFYLGGITRLEDAMPRYCEMNRARATFYRNVKFSEGLVPSNWTRPVYPASTGIGVRGNDLTISCLALRPEEAETMLLPLENPHQVAAYDYAHQYGPEQPKFVRAMAVISGDWALTFISGTASITASESRFHNDIEQQTRQTLDNIEALISPANFDAHGGDGFGATLNDIVLARAYIKRQSDYPAAKAICRARLGDAPVVYVIADVCREELLVEIEAVAFSRRRAS